MNVTTTSDDRRRNQMSATLEAGAVALLLPPVAILCVAVAGFGLGIGVTAWTLWLAIALSCVALRVWTGEWRAAARATAMMAAVHLIAGVVAACFPDVSWDGLAYHQEAVLRLAAGWNPITEDAAAYGLGNDLFINRYPKATWITGAAVLLGTGHIEAGKLFNLTLPLAALCQSAAVLLRLTPLRLPGVAAIAVLGTASPVVVSQAGSFYLDGLLGTLLTIIIVSVTAHVVTLRWKFLAVALLASAFAINVKLTGLPFVAVLLVMGAVALLAWRGLSAALKPTLVVAAVGLASVGVLGYDSYVQNTLETGYPFYPTYGPKPPPMDVAPTRPVNLNDRNRLSRYLISSFSRTEVVRAPGQTHLKIPFTFGPGELRGAYQVDTEAGGFGPLYGPMLLLGAAALLAGFASPLRSLAVGVGVVILCVLASAFIHEETWWARYVPQAWLVPVLMAIPSLCLPRQSLKWWLGMGLVGLTTLNLLIVGANTAWQQSTALRATRAAIDAMRAAEPPVTVYVGPFGALRRRLSEAGLSYEITYTAPAGARPRHAIPTSGNQAFWVAGGEREPGGANAR